MKNILIVKFEDYLENKETERGFQETYDILTNEYPKCSFFFIDTVNFHFYQIHKGKVKQKTHLSPGFYNLYQNYFEYINEEFLTPYVNTLSFNYEEYHSHIEDVKLQLSKPLVIDKWKYKLDIFKFDNALLIEPTHNEKYLDWILFVMYTKGILSEDYDKIKNLLIDFDKPIVKSSLKKSGYSIDIVSYEDDNKLFDAINESYYLKLSEIESGDRKILYQKRKVFENKDWLVVVPESYNEAVTLGRGTYWCTSADSDNGKDMYDYYTTENINKLFIFISKHDEVQKYQWSIVSESFLDWNDKEFKTNDVFDIQFILDYYEYYLNTNYGFNKESSPQGFPNKLILELTNQNIILKNIIFKEVYTKDHIDLIFEIFRDYKNKVKNNLFIVPNIKNNLDILNQDDVPWDYLNYDNMKIYDIIDYSMVIPQEKLIEFIQRERKTDSVFIENHFKNNRLNTGLFEYGYYGHYLFLLYSNDFNTILATIQALTHISKYLNDENLLNLHRIFDENKLYELSLKNPDLIIPLINCKYKLDKYIDTTDWKIHLNIARHGYGLDTLINSPSSIVRTEVLEHGYIDGYDPKSETNSDCIEEYYSIIKAINNNKAKEYINSYGLKCHKIYI